MKLIDADKFLEDNKELAECDFNHSKYCDTLKELIDRTPTVCDIDAIRAEITDEIEYQNSKPSLGRAKGLSAALTIIDKHIKGG